MDYTFAKEIVDNNYLNLLRNCEMCDLPTRRKVHLRY